MSSLALVAFLAAAAAAFAALPLLRGRGGAVPARADAARLELLERRDRALAALKEVELEREAGTVSAEEHARIAASLRAEAAAAIAAIEAGASR